MIETCAMVGTERKPLFVIKCHCFRRRRRTAVTGAMPLNRSDLALPSEAIRREGRGLGKQGAVGASAG